MKTQIEIRNSLRALAEHCSPAAACIPVWAWDRLVYVEVQETDPSRALELAKSAAACGYSATIDRGRCVSLYPDRSCGRG